MECANSKLLASWETNINEIFTRLHAAFSQKRIFNFHCIIGNPRSIIVTLSHDIFCFSLSHINKLSCFSFFCAAAIVDRMFQSIFYALCFITTLTSRLLSILARKSLQRFFIYHFISQWFTLFFIASSSSLWLLEKIFSQYFSQAPLEKIQYIENLSFRLGREWNFFHFLSPNMNLFLSWITFFDIDFSTDKENFRDTKLLEWVRTVRKSSTNWCDLMEVNSQLPDSMSLANYNFPKREKKKIGSDPVEMRKRENFGKAREKFIQLLNWIFKNIW